MVIRKGFTLIELLLVIVILSLLATVGLSMLQRNAATTKVDKAAQQMQILMQAATAYYIDNGCWPNNSIPSTVSNICKPSNAQPQYPATCNSMMPPSFDAYIPQGLSTDPWGHNYTCEAEPTKGKKFSVLIDNLPSATVTKQLINKLPNAKYSSLMPIWVRAEITSPLNANNESFTVEAMGTTGPLSDGDLFTKNLGTTNAATNLQFSCPAGWQGKISTMLMAIDNMPEYSASENLNFWSAACVNAPISSSFYKLNPNVACTAITDSSSHMTTYTCNGTIEFWTYGVTGWCNYIDTTTHYSVGTVNFFYIAGCQAPAPSIKKAANTMGQSF